MKNILHKFNEFRKDSKGGAILFFGFYFIFFLFLILFLRSRHSEVNKKSSYEYDKPNPILYSINSLTRDNYSYHITILLDGIKYEYIGKRNKDELFEYQNDLYYHHDNDFYIKKDVWEKSMNPYLFSDFYQVDTISYLLENAYLDSNIKYDSGKINYYLYISTNTINQGIHKINTDYLELPNSLILSLNEKEELEQIHYYLDSYCTLNKMCNSTLEIIVSFDNIGKIEEIKNPMFLD
ncbi:MAG: hypothetical protein IKE70_05995 [Bacilli bacterium]|nr:hypothetical protein [Bacilli bacterium]